MKIKLPNEIRVMHSAFEDKPVHIANYTISGSNKHYWEIGELSEHDVCELVWVATQNVHDSWSNPDCLVDGTNVDNDPNIDVLVPLKVVKGKKMGHRSTSMGDTVVFVYNNDNGNTKHHYKCDAVGWSKWFDSGYVKNHHLKSKYEKGAA
tara:strand:- start:289 stop:738 length:450 start_codon:yes stop_codon:yes gene_type:complete